MKRVITIIQWTINIAVIFLLVMWVQEPPEDYGYDDYYDDYDVTVVPDEVLALDYEIEEVLANTPPFFEGLYENRGINTPPNLTYLTNKTPLTPEENYAKNIDSVVYISTEDSEEWIYLGAGSVITADGVIATNYHVISDSVKVVVTTASGEHYPVTGVLASDESLDITFLKINATGLQPIAIGDSTAISIGEETLVIGHPEGLINSLSVGNVAGIRDYSSQDAGTNIQITNPISMGNSGGVVLNKYGELIAVPTWSIEYDDNAIQVQNLNFAVPIHEALELLQ